MKKCLGKIMQKTLKNHQKSDQKWSQKPLKNHPKIDVEKNMIFGLIFPICFDFAGVPFSRNLPSVRKVNCRKTNKRKKNKRKRNSAGKEALQSNPNTPLGLRSRPGTDLSCLRQLSAPGLLR